MILFYSEAKYYISENNASILSWFSIFSRVMMERYAKGQSEIFKLMMDVSPIIKVFMYLILLAGLVLGLWRIWKKNLTGNITPFLMMLSTLAILIPSISHDYKICFLSAPLVCLLGDKFRNDGPWVLWNELILFLISLMYCSTFWHFYEHKQGSIFFRINMPALYLIFCLSTALFLINSNHQRRN